MLAQGRDDMSLETEDITETPERVLVLNRVFDAPRALVFKAWTEPEHLARWWGCETTAITSFTGDFRVGGEFRVSMRLSDGIEHRLQGVYRVFDRPECLSFTWAWEDEDGLPGHETLVTVTFTEQNGKTAMALNQAIFDSEKVRDEHHEGWSVGLDRLADLLLALPNA